MSVTAFQDFPLADRDREWDGDAADKRVRKWAGAEDEPNQKYRDAHVWYDSDRKGNFTAYKLLIADVVGGKLKAVPRGVMAAGAIMQGSRGGVDLPKASNRSQPAWLSSIRCLVPIDPTTTLVRNEPAPFAYLTVPVVTRRTRVPSESTTLNRVSASAVHSLSPRRGRRRRNLIGWSGSRSRPKASVRSGPDSTTELHRLSASTRRLAVCAPGPRDSACPKSAVV